MRPFRALALVVVLALAISPAGAEHCASVLESIELGSLDQGCPEPPAPAEEPLPLSGHAYAFKADLSVAGVNVGVPKVSPVALPGQGSGPIERSVLSVEVAPHAALDVLSTSTEGFLGSYTLSSAHTARVSLDTGSLALEATAVRATAYCWGQGPDDQGPSWYPPSGIGHLVINGVSVNVDVPPNTWIPVPGVGGVMLREQWDHGNPNASYQHFTENMIHVYLTTGPVTGDIIISSAHCDGMRLGGAALPPVPR